MVFAMKKGGNPKNKAVLFHIDITDGFKNGF